MTNVCTVEASCAIGNIVIRIESIMHIASAVSWGKTSKIADMSLNTSQTPACDMTTNSFYESIIAFLSQMFTCLMPDSDKNSTHIHELCRPIYRIAVVLLTDLYPILCNYLIAKSKVTETNENNFDPIALLHQITFFSTRFLTMSTTLMSETDNTKVSINSQCISWGPFPFRLKQDHIGAVALLKMSNILSQYSLMLPVAFHTTDYFVYNSFLITVNILHEQSRYWNISLDLQVLNNFLSIQTQISIADNSQSILEIWYGSVIATLLSFRDKSASTMKELR